LAKSDLAYYFQQSIDGIVEAKREAWNIYQAEDTSTAEKLAALKIIVESNEAKFKLLSEGPAVLTMKSLEERVKRVEEIESIQQ
jgi:hypothetical protein